MRKKSLYPLASRFQRSEKLIYAWPEDNPFNRRDPPSCATDTLLSTTQEKAERKGKNLPRRR